MQNALCRLLHQLNDGRAFQFLDKAAYLDQNVRARWRRLRRVLANVRAATAHPSRRSVSAIANQDVDPLAMVPCERFALGVPGDRDLNIPDSLVRKKSSWSLQASLPTHIRRSRCLTAREL